MTNAQTEARAIARCVRGCATDDQYIELVERVATALAAKDAELVARKQAAEHLLERALAAEAQLVDCRLCYEGAQHRYEVAEAQLAEARALAERAGGVKIKALEWIGQDGCGVLGRYEVYEALEGWVMRTPSSSRMLFPDEEAAKAAAQADYERRILSSLTTEPAAPKPSDFRKSRPDLDFTDETQHSAIAMAYGLDLAGKPAAPDGQQPVAWLYDWTDDDGETQTDASTNEVRAVNFKPVRNVRPLFTRPSEQAVTEAWIGAEDEPTEDGTYLVWQKVPPQSHPLQVAKFLRGDWVSSWPVLYWREMLPPPLKAAMEAGR